MFYVTRLHKNIEHRSLNPCKKFSYRFDPTREAPAAVTTDYRWTACLQKLHVQLLRPSSVMIDDTQNIGQPNQCFRTPLKSVLPLAANNSHSENILGGAGQEEGGEDSPRYSSPFRGRARISGLPGENMLLPYSPRFAPLNLACVDNKIVPRCFTVCSSGP